MGELTACICAVYMNLVYSQIAIIWMKIKAEASCKS